MRQKTAVKRRPTNASWEDPGGWDDVPRGPEVVTYSAAYRKLLRRSGFMRVVSLVVGMYISIVVVYVFGFPWLFHIESSTTDEGRKVALLVMTAFALLLAFIWLPSVLMILRPRLFRVSEKRKGPKPKSELFDQDAH